MYFISLVYYLKIFFGGIGYIEKIHKNKIKQVGYLEKKIEELAKEYD